MMSSKEIVLRAFLSFAPVSCPGISEITCLEHTSTVIGSKMVKAVIPMIHSSAQTQEAGRISASRTSDAAPNQIVMTICITLSMSMTDAASHLCPAGRVMILPGYSPMRFGVKIPVEIPHRTDFTASTSVNSEYHLFTSILHFSLSSPQFSGRRMQASNVATINSGWRGHRFSQVAASSCRSR